MLGFERVRDTRELIDAGIANTGLADELDDRQTQRLLKIRREWNFYEGYHWEGMPDVDTPEVTVNYCAAFVNKFVAFELGSGFTFTLHPDYEQAVVTQDGRTLFEYLEDVWEDNNQYIFATELGQMKSVTGDAWVQVRYFPVDELDDPFGEYPDGRLAIMLHNTATIYPEYHPHQRNKIIRLSVIYNYYDYEQVGVLRKKTIKTLKTFKQVWTDKEVSTYYGTGTEPIVTPNRYGVIPFVQVKNFVLAGRNDGVSDLDNIIPMNVEYNLKKSNMSEILDYHAAPVTLVFGAKIGNLEKGANKLWGGLPKDAKVQNLELNGDLGASKGYIDSLKVEMCEVSGVPETVLGGAQSISNTSGVALQYMNLPLIEKTKVKRASTEDGLERLNKLILLVSIFEGLIRFPDGAVLRDFLHNEVTLPDTLPKDTLLELQQIQLELQNDLESRAGALKRLGRENIEEKLAEIDAEREKRNNEQLRMEQRQQQLQQPQINSGFTNSETPQETMNIALRGENKSE